MKLARLNGHGVPEPIVRMLTRLIRRTRWLIAVRGVCAVAATAVGLLLLVMAIDATVCLFSLWTRWALTLSAYGVTALVAAVFLVRPLAHSFTLAGIARTIETHHPELQERISSSVELLTSADAPELRGSDQLIGALVAQATENVRVIVPRREVTLRAARPFLIAAGVVGAILTGLFLAAPRTTAFLLTRASAPFINLPNLRARDLWVRPGDIVLAEGQRLEVEVAVPTRAVRAAYLRRVNADGSESPEPMTQMNPGEGKRLFALSCPPTAEGFRYRIHAGDALTRYYTVTVVPLPAVERLALRYEHPAYTQWTATVETESDGNIRALAGTTVTLTAKTNKPVASAEFLVNGQAAEGAKIALRAKGEGAPACEVRFELLPDHAGRWMLKLADEHGFAGSSPEHTIEVKPDGAPVATILKPETKQLRLPPTARVPISYAIEDDVGLSRAELLVEVDGRGRPPVALPLGTAKKPIRTKVGETTLELFSLGLRNAKYVTFQLKVTDTLPPKFKGPQYGLSDLYRIELDVRAPSFAAAQLMEQEKQLRETLEKVKRDLQSAKSRSERLQQDLPKAKELTPPDAKRVDQMRQDLASAEAGAHKAARQMEGGYFEGLAPKAKELAEEHIAKAENRAEEIKLAEETAERTTLARTTDRLIDRSLKELEDLIKQIEPVADLVRKAVEMDELAKREAELAKAKLAADDAKAKADAGGQPQVAPEDWQKAQQALGKDLGDMLKDTLGAQKAAMEMGQKAAAQLADQAREMAKEQKALAADNQKLDKVQQIDKALGDLAKQQQDLAKEAAGNPAAKDQAPPMGQAADNIQAGQLDAAVAKQAAAENALKQKADELAKGQEAAPQPGEKGQPDAAQPQAQQVAGLAQKQAELREKTDALRAERQQLAGEHQQGQLDRLKAEQAEVAKEAAELADKVGEAAPQPDKLPDQAAGAAAQAAEALKGDQIGEAAQQATQAGKQLGEVAQRMEAAAAQALAPAPQPGQQGNPPGEQGAPPGQEAGQKAGEKGAPAGQEGGQKAGEKGAPAGQEGGQKAGEQGAPAGQEGGQKAGEQGAPAGQEGGQKAGEKGAPAGQEGAPKGGQQAGQPAGQQGGQPVGAQEAAQLAQQAGDLAERQQQLAREMQALAGGNPVGQAAAQQAGIADRAADMAQAAQALQQQAEQLGFDPQAKQQAGEAAGQLGEAQKQAGEAAGQLAQAAGQPGAQPGQPGGQPQPGQPGGQPGQGAPAPGAAGQAQQAAAQALNAAAQALDALGQALGQGAAQAPQGPPGATPGPGQMAQAHQAASQAAQAQSGTAAANAAGQLGQMAAQAAGQAQAMGGGLKNTPYPKTGGAPKKGTGEQETVLSEAKLKELGISLKDWARLPGELRDQILQAAHDAGPEEYRPLIRRYFQELARRGAAEKAEVPGKPGGK